MPASNIGTVAHTAREGQWAIGPTQLNARLAEIRTALGLAEVTPVPLLIPITADDTETAGYIAPRAETITSIRVTTPTAPTSASGTYVLTVTKGADTNVLAATNFSLETITGLAASTLTLSATPANLTLAAGDVIRFAAVSDNADLVVTGERLFITMTTVPA